MTEPRALSVAKAAKRLDVSEGCIRNMVARGELRSFRTGRLIRIPVEAIEAKESGECDLSNTEGNGLSASEDFVDRPVLTPRLKTNLSPNERLGNLLKTL